MSNLHEKDLVQALIKQDDTILARLYVLYAEDLRNNFLHKFPVFQLDPFPLEDIITDALLNLCKNPQKFNPDKSSLKTFLYHDIRGDIINLINKKKSKKNIINNNLVEFDTISGNIKLQEETEEFEIDPAKLGDKLITYFTQIFAEERDQKLAWMIKVEQIRETKKYGRALGIENLCIEEQEVIVKKHKDRINVRLKRSGFDEFLKRLRQNV